MNHPQLEPGAPNMDLWSNYIVEAGCSSHGPPPMPRYMPGVPGDDGPWSPLRISLDQLQRPLPSDTSLFASLSECNYPHAEQNALGTLPVNCHTDDAVSMDFEMDRVGSTRSPDDTLDEPPSGDPVGPPPRYPSPSKPQAAAPSKRQRRKGGRHGPLKAEVRKNAKIMRGTRSCWHCVFMRNKVWHSCCFSSLSFD